MKYFLIAVGLLSSVMPALASFPPGGGGGRPVPVDGGVALFVGAAAIYGAVKLKRKHAKSSQEEA